MAGMVHRATKLTLVFINFLFVVVGVCGMAVGSYVLLYREEVRPLTLIDVATKDFGLLQNAAILLITSGLVLFVLGFVGCCAIYKKQRCLQAVYIGLAVLCCIVTICSCAVAFVFRDDVEEDLLADLRAKLQTEYQGFSTSTVDFSQAWDYAQLEFQCCGIEGYEDYQSAQNWTVRNSATVPLSCCLQTDRDAFLDDNFYTVADINCPQFPTSTNSYIDTPCYPKLKDWMENEAFLMGGVAIAAIILELVAVVFMVVVMTQGPKNTDVLYREHASSY